MAVGDAGAARRSPRRRRCRRSRAFCFAGDLIDAVVHDDDGEVARLDHADGGETAERHQDRAVAFERDHPALGLGERDTERDRAGKVPCCRACRNSAGGGRRHRDRNWCCRCPRPPLRRALSFATRRLVRSARLSTWTAWRIDGGSGHVRSLTSSLAAASGFPPVSSGDRMNTHRALGGEGLLDRLVDDERHGGVVGQRMVLDGDAHPASAAASRATVTWPMLNSPSVPRSETTMIAGIW